MSQNPSSRIPAAAKAALLGACFFWAASFIATKKALDSTPPLTVVTLRLIVSALCFLLWIIIAKQAIPFRGVRRLGRLFVLSLFGTGLHYGIQTLGMELTTASNASLYAVTGPITITIIAVIFLGEKITLKKTLGIGIALLGVIMVMGYETLINFDLEGHLLGDLMVLASIFMWGVFSVLGKGMTRQLGALPLTAAVTFMGALYMIPLGFWEIDRRSFSLSSITPGAWGAIAFLGITCSFLATLLYFYALEKSEAQKVGVYLYTIPPMTYIIAAIFLKETIGLNLVLGSLVVFAGVYLTEKG